MANEVFVDIENSPVETSVPSGTDTSSPAQIEIGLGSKVFRADQSGIWLGAAKFATAPFKVDMEGNLTATTLTITGYIASGGAAADVNAGVTTINAAKINISGSTTFTSGYDPSLKVDEVAGTYTTTSTSAAAKVRIFPDANTGIIAYASNGTTVVFKVEVGGTGVGDVTIGNYAGGTGMLWDQSAGALYIKGSMTAGTITGVTITGSTFKTASSGARVEMTASGSKITIYDDDGDPYLELDNQQIIFASRSTKSSETNAIYYYKSGGSYGFKTRMEGGDWAIDQTAW